MAPRWKMPRRSMQSDGRLSDKSVAGSGCAWQMLGTVWSAASC